MVQFESIFLQFLESLPIINMIAKLTNDFSIKCHTTQNLYRKDEKCEIKIMTFDWVQSAKSRHQYLRFFKKELSISRF